MDEDRIKAAAKQVGTTIRQAVRMLTGTAETRAESAAGKAPSEAERTRKQAKRTVSDIAKE